MKFLLGFALFCLRFARAMVVAGTNFVTDINFKLIPHTITGFNNMLIQTPPNTLRCFNKTGLLIFFTDFYVLWYMLHKIRNIPVIGYLYVAVKIVTIAVPLFYLTAADRLPF